MKLIFTCLGLFFLQTIAFGQTLSSLEAVEYDAFYNRFLIANGSNIISRLPNGTLEYFNDNAPIQYGMEIIGNTLFGIQSGSVERVRGYNLETGEEVMNLTVSGASSLNGMATDGDSLLWVTDFSNSRLYKINVLDLDNPTYEIVIDDTGTTPNGIVYDEANDRLVFVNWNNNPPIVEVDPTTYEMTTLTSSGVSNVDGIDNDGEGNFYIASWSPQRITKFWNNFTQSEVITVPGLSNPADISYAMQTDTLAIPNSGNNTMIYVGFGATDIPESSLDFGFNLYPNPATEASRILFTLPQSSVVELRILDSAGKLVHVLLTEEKLLAGNHQVLLAGLAFEKGYYLCELQAMESVLHFPFLVE
jgi:hypothetical protein